MVDLTRMHVLLYLCLESYTLCLAPCALSLDSCALSLIPYVLYLCLES